jgi:hypothetical protein
MDGVWVRVSNERIELSNKMKKLDEFRRTESFSNLSEDHQRLLNKQFLAMKEYRTILDERIALFEQESRLQESPV